MPRSTKSAGPSDRRNAETIENDADRQLQGGIRVAVRAREDTERDGIDAELAMQRVLGDRKIDAVEIVDQYADRAESRCRIEAGGSEPLPYRAALRCRLVR